MISDSHRAVDARFMVWWAWVLVSWLGMTVIAVLPLGLAIRGTRARPPRPGDAGSSVDLITARRPTSELPQRHRPIPVPPLATLLLVTGVGLEAVGFALRAAGLDRGTARLLSMDGPMSVPRFFVAALFAAAAAAAVAGAVHSPGRRAWWLSVAALSTAISSVKAGGTVHVRALEAFGVRDKPVVAAVGSAVVVAAVLGLLYCISRAERRDRRRVLSAFGYYAFAAAGLSAVSSMAGSWSTAVTFIEESGEVLGGVAVLMAVLVGVAPRLVLPSDWVLRRIADAGTVDAPGAPLPWSTAHSERRR
jgi:hypothetical protein